MSQNQSSPPNTPVPPADAVSGLIAEEAISERLESEEDGAVKVATPLGNEIEFVLKQQFVDSLNQNRGERAKYAKYTFRLTCIWISVVMLFIFLSGWGEDDHRVLYLSDKVLITLITTTTVNVFGFFLLVMKFLFNKEELAALSFLFNPKGEVTKPKVTKHGSIRARTTKTTKEGLKED